MGNRPGEPRTAPPPVLIRARRWRAVLVCSLLLPAACAPGRLADLPDRPAGAIGAQSDDQTRQHAIATLRDAFLQRGEVASSRQPIAPTFAPKATRLETVRVMLSISHMGTRPYDVEQVYRRLDPSLQTAAQRLRAIGADGDVEFREVLRELTDSLGACLVPIARFRNELRHDGGPVVIVAPMKGERRIVEKALTHYLGDVSLVQDLVRGSVAVDHPADVRVLAGRTLAMLRQRGIEITEIEDHFTNTSVGGYRDFQINFRLPRTRIIGELQLHVKDLLVVKQRVGHGVYERARLACAAKEMGITNADVSAVCAHNAREMASSYDRAYRRAWSRPRIRSRPCVPASTARNFHGRAAVESGPSSWLSSSRLRPMPQPAKAPTVVVSSLRYATSARAMPGSRITKPLTSGGSRQHPTYAETPRGDTPFRWYQSCSRPSRRSQCGLVRSGMRCVPWRCLQRAAAEGEGTTPPARIRHPRRPRPRRRPGR